MARQPIVIAGGGIAGLSAAIGLARLGHDVHVLERATAFRELGAGLQIGPNAVRALQAIGAWDAVEPITRQPPAIRVMSGLTGQVLQKVTLGKQFEETYGAPYRVAHRADLHSALLQVAQSMSSISIETGNEVFKSEDIDCLIAADGVRSKLRSAVFNASEASQLPYTIHRALFAGNVSSVIADFESVHLWLFPGAHVVHYPVASGNLNAVVVMDGANAPLKPSITSQVFRHFNAEWTEWPALIAPPLGKWFNERVCLIGDAAHGTLPFLAQGAAMALEDAACLAKCFKTHDDNATRFAAFQAERQPRTSRLHKQTLSMGRLYHLSRIPSRFRDTAFRMLPSSTALRSVQWIYRGK
jgi:salicylate hydroxylase